jgi:hypothetical protein
MAITIKKYYFVPGRKDLFGYAIFENGSLAKNRSGLDLIFYKKSDANDAAALRKKSSIKKK